MALQPVNMGLPLIRELGAKLIVEMAEYISNNPQFVIQGFAHSGISLALDGINIEEDSDEDTSDDDYEEDDEDEENDDNGEDDNDEEDDSNEEDYEGDEEEEACSEYEHNDEELYIEDGAELSDSYQFHGNNDIPIVIDDEDWPEDLPNQYLHV